MIGDAGITFTSTKMGSTGTRDTCPNLDACIRSQVQLRAGLKTSSGSCGDVARLLRHNGRLGWIQRHPVVHHPGDLDRASLLADRTGPHDRAEEAADEVHHESSQESVAAKRGRRSDQEEHGQVMMRRQQTARTCRDRRTRGASAARGGCQRR